MWQRCRTVLQDPATELLALVRRAGERPSIADRQSAALVRRRFGVALPPPFAPAADPVAMPLRRAEATDGPAIAAVKWRSFGSSYRGVLPDAFLDRLEVVPAPSFWSARAATPPSPRHSLVVLGRRGEVHGYCDAGPSDDDDLDPAVTGEVYELYLDPTAQRKGAGGRLLDDAIERLSGAGFSDLRLWALSANDAAHGFYGAHGWTPDGVTRREDLGAVTFDERRYRRMAGGTVG